jgi:uncharacterized iron-regulated membrane protein
MIVLAVVCAFILAAFIALWLWSRRSERDIDYTPTHDEDEKLKNTARAAAISTIGNITGSQ